MLDHGAIQAVVVAYCFSCLCLQGALKLVNDCVRHSRMDNSFIVHMPIL